MSVCVRVREKERVKIVQFIRPFLPDHLDHSDDALKINDYRLFHAGFERFQRCWSMEGTWWDQKWMFWPIPEQQQEPKESGCVTLVKVLFLCVKETIIMTNAHSSATRHSLNNFRLPDEIWKPKATLQCLCSKCSSWSVFLLRYNLQSTGGRRWAATRQRHKGVEQKVAG